NGTPEGSGYISLYDCRAEGGQNSPEFDFSDTDQIVMINCSGEGKQEYPADIAFVNCEHIQIIGGSIAKPDQSWVFTTCKSLVFANSGGTITRSDMGGSFVTDGWTIGQRCLVTGSSSNNADLHVTNVTATVLTVSDTLVNETTSAATLRGNRAGD